MVRQRTRLKGHEFERRTFTAEFIRYGKKGYDYAIQHTTVLLENVRDSTGRIVAAHLWINGAKPFYEAKLNYSDLVRFEGEVIRYGKSKGFDFAISNISNVRNVSDTNDYAVAY
jgi:hypothetical protein